jgi:hypothetical protein
VYPLDVQSSQEQQKEQYDKHSSLRCFQLGDVVYLRRQKSVPLAQKFLPTFDGPWIVETTYGNHIYGLRHHILGKKKKVHINILKLGKFQEQFRVAPAAQLAPAQVHRPVAPSLRHRYCTPDSKNRFLEELLDFTTS